MHDCTIPDLPDFLKREKPVKQDDPYVSGDDAALPSEEAKRMRDDRMRDDIPENVNRVFLSARLKGYGLNQGWHTYEVISLGKKWAHVHISGKAVKLRRKVWDGMLSKD